MTKDTKPQPATPPVAVGLPTSMPASAKASVVTSTDANPIVPWVVLRAGQHNLKASVGNPGVCVVLCYQQDAKTGNVAYRIEGPTRLARLNVRRADDTSKEIDKPSVDGKSFGSNPHVLAGHCGLPQTAVLRGSAEIRKFWKDNPAIEKSRSITSVLVGSD